MLIADQLARTFTKCLLDVVALLAVQFCWHHMPRWQCWNRFFRYSLHTRITIKVERKKRVYRRTSTKDQRSKISCVCGGEISISQSLRLSRAVFPNLFRLAAPYRKE